MILTETKERVCVWGLFYLFTVVLWIKILGREKEIPWYFSINFTVTVFWSKQ